MQKNRILPLIAGAAIQLCIGIIYIWSIFQAPVKEYYGWDNANITFSVMLATFVLGIVTGGRLNDKKGPRPVVLMGGIMFTAGIFLSSLVPVEYPWLIAVFYGGLAGFGVGAAYTSTISAAQKWFPDKKGFATGVIVCTFGASTVVFTPLVNYLLATVGVSQTFLYLSIIFLAVILIFAWFVKNPPKEYTDSFAIKTPALSNQRQFTPFEVLKTKQYYIMMLCMFCLTPAYFILIPTLKTLGTLRGLSEGIAIFGVMITGIASATGRLVAPWLSDKIGRKNALFLITALTLVSILMLIFAQDYFFLVLIAIIAFSFGGSAGVFPAIAADYFGTKNIGANYGLVMIGFAAAGLTFPNVASALTVDGIPTAMAFIVPGVVCLVGLILTFMLKAPKQEKA